MKASDFIAKWSLSSLRERQGSQEHFIDLCRLLGQPTPAEDDPKGERYCFERGAAITGGGDGWVEEIAPGNSLTRAAREVKPRQHKL